MVKRLVSVDNDTLQFPDVVRETVADNLGDPGTVEGEKVVQRAFDRERIEVTPAGGDDTAGVQAFLDDVKAGKRDGYLRDNTYRVSNLTLDYSSDSDVSLGFVAPRIGGGSKRGTILEQIPGSTGPVLNVIGKASTPSHTGKVTGLVIENLTIKGTSTGSDGIRLRSITDAVIRDFWIQGCGRHGIALDRQTFTVGVADEYGYGIQIENGKSLLNAGRGVATIGGHPIGPLVMTGVELESNTLGGLYANPSSFTLVECYIGGNSGPGVEVDYAPSSLNAYGFRMFGGRVEGNTGYEIDLKGGHSHIVQGVVILGTTGAHCIRVGGGTSTSNDAQIIGCFLSGDNATAGQKALIIGSNATGTQVMSPRFETPEFDDYVNDITDLITNSAPSSTRILHRQYQRSTNAVMVAAAGSDRSFESWQKGDTFRRWSVRGDGYMQWGGGSGAPDVDMYRDNVNRVTMGAGDSFKVDGTWNGGMLLMGAYRLWVDGTGALRIKNGVPSSDTDGTVVGTQT